MAPSGVSPVVTGASILGASPAFTLSGSFPHFYSGQNVHSGLADAIALGLFDGAAAANAGSVLPFSVAPPSHALNSKSFEAANMRLEGFDESPPFDVFHREQTRYASGSGTIAQSPPPFVAMTNANSTLAAPVRANSAATANTASAGSVASSSSASAIAATVQSQHAHATSVANELSDFIKTVDSKRKSLAVQRPGAASSKPGGSKSGSSSAGKKTSKTSALAKFAQFKDSYGEFSNSLIMATSSTNSRTPSSTDSTAKRTPIKRSNSPSPPALPISATSSSPPRLSQPLSLIPANNVHPTHPAHPKPQHKILAEKTAQVRRPSALQYATVLSAVLSESGDSSGSATAGPSKPDAAHLSEDDVFDDATEEMLVVGLPPPKRPPILMPVPLSVSAAENSPLVSADSSKNVYAADPKKVSSGFFPVAASATPLDGLMPNTAMDESSTGMSPALAITAVSTGGFSALRHSSTSSSSGCGTKPPASSLSTSLRSAQATTAVSAGSRLPIVSPADALFVPARTQSAGGEHMTAYIPATPGMARRNSSSAVVGVGGGILTRNFGAFAGASDAAGTGGIGFGVGVSGRGMFYGVGGAAAGGSGIARGFGGSGGVGGGVGVGVTVGVGVGGVGMGANTARVGSAPMEVPSARRKMFMRPNWVTDEENGDDDDEDEFDGDATGTVARGAYY
ncbi:hypothetical protein HDU82_002261 [Entophlyctis luteolus]|nr:hypothetical protein HDU82_002261 [Entophlyctis luteolus]